jgi:ribosome-binding factor A
MNERQEKLSTLLKKLSANFLQEESSGKSMMTVTNCLVSDNMRSAKILLTILPESEEDNALNFAKRKRGGFKKYIKSNARLKYIPFIDFEIDKGEKSRQRIDELLREN